MRPANWKRARPRDLRHAFRLCVEYAREVKRLKVDTIAELMGESVDNLYKWMHSGRMPAILIPAFEHACGTDFATRYLASSNHRLVIDIPHGRKCDATEVAELNALFADCVVNLSKYFNGKAHLEDTIDSIDAALRALAWHQENVGKHFEPELALFDKDVDK